MDVAGPGPVREAPARAERFRKDPFFTFQGMNPGPMKRLLALAAMAALAHTGATVKEVHEGSAAAQISFDVPKNWVVQNETELFISGFIVPPEPLFALVASPARAPSDIVLQASSAPWLFVTVEDPPVMLPPSQTYELLPQYLKEAEPGYSGATVKTLVAHRPVHEGGLSGSAAALMVVSPAGSTSFDERTYEKGSQLWLIIAGCSTSCYEHNRTTITQVVDGARVGTAA
jgi:hypothetical protein